MNEPEPAGPVTSGGLTGSPVTPSLTSPGSPDQPPADTRPQYEFDAAQNGVITDLALAITWVRLPLLVVAVLQGVIAVGLAFRIPRDGAHVIGVLGHGLAAVVCFLLAGWLSRAATAFARVATTAGSDISHLMTGLRNLGAWFDLLAFFVKLYLALLGVVVLLLLIGLIAGAFKGPV